MDIKYRILYRRGFKEVSEKCIVKEVFTFHDREGRLMYVDGLTYEAKSYNSPIGDKVLCTCITDTIEEGLRLLSTIVGKELTVTEWFQTKSDVANVIKS